MGWELSHDTFGQRGRKRGVDILGCTPLKQLPDGLSVQYDFDLGILENAYGPGRSPFQAPDMSDFRNGDRSFSGSACWREVDGQAGCIHLCGLRWLLVLLTFPKDHMRTRSPGNMKPEIPGFGDTEREGVVVGAALAYQDFMAVRSEEDAVGKPLFAGGLR